MNNLKILLVDDEPDVLDFLSFNLQKEGYEVYTASEGREAVQMAKKVAIRKCFLVCCEQVRWSSNI